MDEIHYKRFCLIILTIYSCSMSLPWRELESCRHNLCGQERRTKEPALWRHQDTYRKETAVVKAVVNAQRQFPSTEDVDRALSSACTIHWSPRVYPHHLSYVVYRHDVAECRLQLLPPPPHPWSACLVRGRQPILSMASISVSSRRTAQARTRPSRLTCCCFMLSVSLNCPITTQRSSLVICPVRDELMPRCIFALSPRRVASILFPSSSLSSDSTLGCSFGASNFRRLSASSAFVGLKFFLLIY